MKRKRMASFYFVAMTVPASAVGVDLVDGDVTGLLAALEGGVDAPLEVRLASRGTYALPTSLPPITGFVSIDGRGATITTVASGDTLRVGGTGNLAVNGVRFSKLTIWNEGRLTLRESSMADARPMPFLRHGYAGVITNGQAALLQVENTTFARMRALLVASHAAVIMNHGQALLTHVTFADNTRDDPDSPWGLPATLSSVPLTTIQPPPNLLIANSVIGDPAINSCAGWEGGGIESRGGNVFDDATCMLAASDIVATPDFGVFGAHGGDPDTVPIGGSSPAIDAGLAESCLSTDARGVPRHAVRCDAGAFERVQSLDGPNWNGLNGVWMSAAGDGQYVTLQRVTESAVLVVWFGFDGGGGNSLVYGVGNLDNGTIVVSPASRSADGRMQPDGSVVGATVTPWGMLRVVVPDCHDATLFHRASTAPAETGLALARLATVHDIGCTE